ncbi:hypothetical protein VTN96DRAFT_5211 [Rasamsonia emersonii]
MAFRNAGTGRFGDTAQESRSERIQPQLFNHDPVTSGSIANLTATQDEEWWLLCCDCPDAVSGVPLTGQRAGCLRRRRRPPIAVAASRPLRAAPAFSRLASTHNK